MWGLIAFRLLGSVLRGFGACGLCLHPFILFVFGLLGGLVVLRCASWACCSPGCVYCVCLRCYSVTGCDLVVRVWVCVFLLV